jgi:peptide-methionine (S)-S-oxide reductase
MNKNNRKHIDTITLGAGCFWCLEGIFSIIKGVTSTTIGYGGGNTPNPTYASVSSNPSGHAELTVIEFNTSTTTLDKLLTVFFAMHDPNKTFVINDKKGELYRSVILYKDEFQKGQIENFISNYQIQTAQKIKTEVLPFKNFNKTDLKYQKYYSSNPDKPFCKNVIGPKIAKLRAKGIL